NRGVGGGIVGRAQAQGFGVGVGDADGGVVGVAVVVDVRGGAAAAVGTVGGVVEQHLHAVRRLQVGEGREVVGGDAAGPEGGVGAGVRVSLADGTGLPEDAGAQGGVIYIDVD